MSENQKSASAAKSGSAQKGSKGKNSKEQEKKVVVEEQEPEEDEDEEGDDEEDGDEEDDEDDEETNLPAIILKRISGLLKLHSKIETEIDTEYIAERVQLEIKYREKRDVVYEQRRQIVAGLIEPIDDEPKDETAKDPETAADAAADTESDIKGVPQFWLQALGNHPLIADLLQEEDVPALEFLQDIAVVYNETYTTFTLQFHFAENPYFSNDVLEKTYTLEPNVLDERPDLVDYKSPTINWKPGKNLCVKEIKKKQKAKSGKNKGQVRTITREVPKASFFHYFSDPKADEEEEEDEEKEDEEKERIQLTEEEDFEIAHVIRTLIAPNAIMWFTGQAQDENYMGYDEEDDDDEEGEDGEDEEDDDDDAEAPKLAKTKGGFAPANPATAGGDQPECKQN